MSGKDGREMKEVKTKRSAETEGTEDVKKKKVEQPTGKFSVSNCTVCTVHPHPCSFTPKVTEDGFTKVFTDGQCIFLGKAGQQVGLGVWWDGEHRLNCSQKGGGQK